MTNLTQDYPYIRKWGSMMGSFRDYIEGQVALARKDDAPRHAIYRREDGTWRTTDDVTRASTRAFLGLAPLDEVATGVEPSRFEALPTWDEEPPEPLAVGVDDVDPWTGEPLTGPLA